MSSSTRLINVPEAADRHAAPLTTPIYETTTFVFENAQEVLDYNEGRSAKYLYSRYANPTVTDVERRIAALEGAERALLMSSGQAATTTALLALAKAGDEIVCSSAIYGGTLHLLADLLPKFGIRPRFVDDRRAARRPRRRCRRRRGSCGSSRRSIRRCAASTSRRLPAACRARGVIVGHRQHLRQPDQPAADRARHRHRHAQRDQVPERPQRRDRRRAGGIGGGDGDDAEGAQAGRGGPRSVCGLCARPRVEDAAGSHGAAQRQRARGGRVARAQRPRRDGLLSGPGVASRSRDCGQADARVRRDGLRRRRRRVRARRARSSIACRCSSARRRSAASRACAAFRC